MRLRRGAAARAHGPPVAALQHRGALTGARAPGPLVDVSREVVHAERAPARGPAARRFALPQLVELEERGGGRAPPEAAPRAPRLVDYAGRGDPRVAVGVGRGLLPLAREGPLVLRAQPLALAGAQRGGLVPVDHHDRVRARAVRVLEAVDAVVHGPGLERTRARLPRRRVVLGAALRELAREPPLAGELLQPVDPEPVAAVVLHLASHLHHALGARAARALARVGHRGRLDLPRAHDLPERVVEEAPAPLGRLERRLQAHLPDHAHRRRSARARGRRGPSAPHGLGTRRGVRGGRRRPRHGGARDAGMQAHDQRRAPDPARPPIGGINHLPHT